MTLIFGQTVEPEGVLGMRLGKKKTMKNARLHLSSGGSAKEIQMQIVY